MDGKRIDDGVVRKTLEIEAGPLLQALNILREKIVVSKQEANN